MFLTIALAAARVAIVDVGAEAAGPTARMAIENALRGSSVGDEALRDAMFGVSPNERARLLGRAALDRARAAFADAKCDQVDKELDEAERQLGKLPVAEVGEQMVQIYRYRHGCAVQRHDAAQTARFARVVDALGGSPLPGGAGADAGAAPPPAPSGPPVPVDVQIEAQPDDATVLVDGKEVGRGAHPLTAGVHVLDVERAGYRKLHRLIDVAAPGPVRLPVVLAAQPADPYASAQAAVQTLRGAQIETHLSAISEIAMRAQADKVLLVDVSGDTISARIFDPEAGVLDQRHWKGEIHGSTVAGLADFVAGKGGTIIKAPAPPPQKKRPTKAIDTSDTWSHWYSWVIAGALGVAAGIFIISATASTDQLTVRSVK